MVNNIGGFMQELRKERNLTQKELADRIGVSDKTISKWENGNSIPDTSMLLPLCGELEISVNELLAGQKIPPEEYSMRAEENMMALMQENEKTKKGNFVLQIIGGILILVSLIFLGISFAGINFPVTNFMDWPSLLGLCLLELGIVLLSGAKTKEKVLQILSKTFLPSGLLISLGSAIFVLAFLSGEGLELVGPNLGVAFLALLYAVIGKLVVEVLVMKNSISR